MTEPTQTKPVKSRVLGEIHVDPDGLLRFPHGVLGFPEAREFALVSTSRQGFYWLQSVEHDTLTFLLLDPFVHVPEFSIDIPDDELGTLGTDAAEIVVLGVVTLPTSPEEPPTVNLQGPLLINARKGVGRQLILADSPWGLRHCMDLADALLAS